MLRAPTSVGMCKGSAQTGLQNAQNAAAGMEKNQGMSWLQQVHN